MCLVGLRGEGGGGEGGGDRIGHISLQYNSNCIAGTTKEQAWPTK